MISLFGPPEPTLLERLKDSVSKTRSELSARVEQLLTGDRPVDPELLKQLESALLSADLGVRTTKEVLAALRQQVNEHKLEEPGALKRELKNQILKILTAPATTQPNADGKPADEPRVLFVVGVNGTGKTTTIGKLTNRLKKEGATVVLCAADTFRAAAIEQLEIWARRSGVEMIKQKPGADPSAVVFDACRATIARKSDILIVDTAGRLHTKVNLMEEMKKIRRILGREIPGAPHETLLILDAATGQNAISQAKLFKESADVTGIALTKLDGTAKGGIVVAISNEFKIPVRFIGVGETVDDLREFDPAQFVEALFQ